MTRPAPLNQAFTLLESLVMLAAVSIFALLLAGLLKAQKMPPKAVPVEAVAPAKSVD
jgi:hypothetical protein